MSLSRDGSFLLGKVFDLAQGKLLEDPVTYDPADLTTHGVVTGMTGSGKTGMCVGLLEEAAIEGIPAIIIDPKGDLTNLLLHFPELRSEDFKPWIDPEIARRDGKGMDTAAAETAESWRKGLAGWGLGTADIRLLKDSVRFGLFTPGSTAGTPVNILSSFAAPEVPWDEHREMLREKISTIVTALLGLIGINEVDPLRSREHILLSNILENAWGKGESLTLVELILRTQTPPFENLGAFAVNSFFPEKDRFDLAMRLNSFLASPSFEVWREGQSLDIGSMLYGPSGKPRHNIFYLAHLNDSERMFFVTLLFASIESWMRTQRGTSSLRMLVYFDEIVGYLPPVANPPSRPIMLRMLKQARAFGVGLLLATQNPIDVDYRGLSNAGTWVIGRLQTDQDKQRLLDGLDSAGGGLDRKEVDRIISALPKRTFFIHNVHAKAPRIFQTRFVLNYLAGPMMRSQIPDLMKLDGVEPLSGAATSAPGLTAGSDAFSSATADVRRETAPVQTAAAATTALGEMLTTTRPGAPAGTDEYLLPADVALGKALARGGLGSAQGITQGDVVYRPALLAQAQVAYSAPKYGLNFTRPVTSLPSETRGRGVVWEDFGWKSYDAGVLHQSALPDARYTQLPGWLADGRTLSSLKKDFSEWVYRNATIQVRTVPALGIYAAPEVSEGEFQATVQKSADTATRTALDALSASYRKKTDDLARKIRKQEMQVESEEGQLRARQAEEVGKAGEVVLGLLGIGRKKSISSSITKRRLTSQAKQDLEQEHADLEELQKQLEELEAEHTREVTLLQQRASDEAMQVTEVPVTPYKKDIFVDLFGIAWCPYYTVTVNGQQRELPAFSEPD
jgi:hypothetical protein